MRSSRPTFILIAIGILGATFSLSAVAQEPPPAGESAATPPAAQQTPTEPPATAPATQPAVSTTQEQPPPTKPVEPTVTEITTDEVQARMKQIEGATDLPDTVRTQLLDLYRQTLDQITATKTWSDQAEKFRQGIEQAPDLLKEARAEREQATSRPATQPSLNVPADASMDWLAQQQANAEAQLKQQQENVSRLDTEADNRSQRAKVIPDSLTDANARLAKVTAELSAPPVAGTPPQVVEAQRRLRQARRRAIEAEIRSLQSELDYYAARSELLATRRDVARLRLNEAKARADAWRELVNQRRQAEADRQKREAEAELARTPPSIRALAEKNTELAAEMSKIQELTADATARREKVAAQVGTLSAEMKSLQDRVGQPALGEYVALQMRRARRELIELRRYERQLEQDQSEAQRVALEQDEYDQERSELVANPDQRMKDELKKALEANPGASVDQLRPLIQERLDRRRELLLNLDNAMNTYLFELRDLMTQEGRLLEQVNTYSDFIDEHVLWIRSAAPLQSSRLPHDLVAVDDGLVELGRQSLRDIGEHPVVYATGFLLLALVIAMQPRCRRRLRDIRERVTKIYSDRFTLTLSAIGYTFVLALPWPVAFALAGLALGRVVPVTESTAYELARSLGGGLIAAARVLLILGFLRQSCRGGGLFEAHFRWNSQGVRLTRRQLAWMIPLLAISTVVIAATELYPSDEWRTTVGRGVFVIAMFGLSLFSLRIMHPAHGILAARLERNPSGWAHRLRYLWYGLIVAVPLALVVAAWVGYYYTAIQFAKQIIRTLWVLIGLLFLHALAVRWLYIAQRRLAMEQARKKRAALIEARAAQAKAAGEGADVGEPPPPIDEGAFDIVSIGEQTRDLLRSLLIFGLVIGALVSWSDLLPALSFMDRVQLWPYTVQSVTSGAEGTATTTVTEYITLKHVALAIIIAIATYVLTRNIPGLLEIAILRRLPIDTGGRFAVTAIARYVIIVLGVMIAFAALGIGWSKVQWLIAAISVGLGFGLQEIFANFVSGLMLLFERPIRIGDTVTVGGVSGTITRIRIRATTITDWDRKELIIPNKEFITGQVINWTLSDQLLRIIIPVGIAYGSDTEKAEELLLQIAREEPNVLAEPEPRALFLGFGDNSLNYELRVFIPSVDYLLQTKHRLHKAIDREFRKASIEIAFPQRDIHIRSIEATLPVVDRNTSLNAPSSPKGDGGGQS